MVKYHGRTLELLGSEGLLVEQPLPGLIDWANVNDILLPAAYLEWAQLDHANLLQKYSNDDWFGFSKPKIITTPQGIRGLLFNCENQGNFSKIVALDHGEDPPVLYAWLGKAPWITHTERFSACIFAQIFDWQYWLEFKANDPGYKEIAYAGEIELRADRCLAFLRGRFEETVATAYAVESSLFTEYRFTKSPKERMTVTVGDSGATSIRITGEKNLVPALEAELLEVFTQEVVPPSFNSIGWAADFLGSRIDHQWIQQLRHAFVDKPNVEVIQALAACHRALPIRNRVQNISFPGDQTEFDVGGSNWGITIRFIRKDQYWWRLNEVIKTTP
jgi:hypothetical protein